MAVAAHLGLVVNGSQCGPPIRNKTSLCCKASWYSHEDRDREREKEKEKEMNPDPMPFMSSNFK